MRLGSLIIGIGSLVGGVSALRDGVKPAVPRQPINRVDLGRHELIPKHGKGKPLKASIHKVKTINGRVKHIVTAIQKGRKDPDVRAFAVKAVSRKCGKKFCIAERDYDGEIKAVFKDIRHNIRYVRDAHKLDTFQSPRRTLEFGGGDCDDYTITMGAALQSIGYPVKLRIIQTKGAPDFNHIFLLVGVPPRAPTKWIPLDASVNKPAGWHPPHKMIAKIKDFDVP
jgi:transglutaminase-like putative cysteine protease